MMLFAQAAQNLTDPQVTHALARALGQLQPEILLGAVACLIFLGGTVAGKRNLWGVVALLGLFAALWVTFADPTYRSGLGQEIYTVPIVVDSLAQFTRVVALCTGILLLLLSWRELPDRQAADHHACLLILTAGMSLVGSANDLTTMFLALELVSIPTYVMIYLPRF